MLHGWKKWGARPQEGPAPEPHPHPGRDAGGGNVAPIQVLFFLHRTQTQGEAPACGQGGLSPSRPGREAGPLRCGCSQRSSGRAPGRAWGCRCGVCRRAAVGAFPRRADPAGHALSASPCWWGSAPPEGFPQRGLSSDLAQRRAGGSPLGSESSGRRCRPHTSFPGHAGQCPRERPLASRCGRPEPPPPPSLHLPATPCAGSLLTTPLLPGQMVATSTGERLPADPCARPGWQQGDLC